jgi:cysteine desulfurase
MWSLFTKKEGEEVTSKRIYLDHAAATPMTDVALSAMVPFFQNTFGNAGAIHSEGVAAKTALEDFRTRVARVLGIQASGVVFTSGGTESNNLALVGYVEHLHVAGRAYADMEIITTALEHPATLRTLDGLATKGALVTTVPVTAVGHIDMKALATAVSTKTVLVSVAYVNSEVGTITECRDIRRVLDKAEKTFGTTILLHIDAAQAPLWLPCDLTRLGADLLSLDAGKCGGPKGAGVLAWRKGVTIAPLLRGGGQEMGIRPGTEPLPLVAGMTVALEEAQAGWPERAGAVMAVRDYFLALVEAMLPTAIINGPSAILRVANNVHISIPGLDAEFAVITLDVHGIASSTKSACSSKGGGASAVVLAMTGDEVRALSTLRFTLGPDTTTEDIDRTVSVLKTHLETVQK